MATESVGSCSTNRQSSCISLQFLMAISFISQYSFPTDVRSQCRIFKVLKRPLVMLLAECPGKVQALDYIIFICSHFSYPSYTFNALSTFYPFISQALPSCCNTQQGFVGLTFDLLRDRVNPPWIYKTYRTANTLSRS